MKQAFANIKTWLIPAAIGAGITLLIFLLRGSKPVDNTKHYDELLKVISNQGETIRAAQEKTIEVLEKSNRHLEEDRIEIKEQNEFLISEFDKIKKSGIEKANSIKYYSVPDIERYLSEIR